MIPLRDTIPSQSFPLTTLALIAVNVLVFFYELGLGSRVMDQFLLHYGFVPAVYFHVSHEQPWNLPARFAPMLSSMFLHGGWMHLIGNMWTLWIFGVNVEDRLGRGKYLVLYLASGVAAALVHIYTNLGSEVPTLGASGAI